MADLFDGWTRDAAGKYVDWTKPPYRRGGLLELRLAGEKVISHNELSRRLGEYMKLTRRELRRQNGNGPGADTHGAVGSRQGQLV